MYNMKGIVFDLDGVITDTARFHFEAWKKLTKEKFGKDLPASFESEVKGISRIESLERIMDFYGIRDRYTQEEIEAMAAEKDEYYRREIATLTKEDILPGIAYLLADLKDHRVKTALASASHNAPFILERLGLTDMFDGAADPSAIAHGKPAPDIFLAAAKSIGLEPDDCVGVEDAVAGVAGIRAAHMPAVGIGDAKELHEANRVVSSTKELTMALLEDVWDKRRQA